MDGQNKNNEKRYEEIDNWKKKWLKDDLWKKNNDVEGKPN